METLLFEQSSVEAELAGMLGAPLTKDYSARDVQSAWPLDHGGSSCQPNT
jgi:hypothetical protein